MSIATSSNSHERTLLVAVGVCLLDVLLTGGAELASYLTLRAVRRSPDERYACGIGKLENLASMAIAVMMWACAGVILLHASHAVRFPEPVEGTLPCQAAQDPNAPLRVACLR